MRVLHHDLLGMYVLHYDVLFSSGLPTRTSLRLRLRLRLRLKLSRRYAVRRSISLECRLWGTGWNMVRCRAGVGLDR